MGSTTSIDRVNPIKRHRINGLNREGDFILKILVGSCVTPPAARAPVQCLTTPPGRERAAVMAAGGREDDE